MGEGGVPPNIAGRTGGGSDVKGRTNNETIEEFGDKKSGIHDSGGKGISPSGHYSNIKYDE